MSFFFKCHNDVWVSGWCPAYLLLWWMSSYAISGRGTECILTFISTFHAMQDQGKCVLSPVWTPSSLFWNIGLCLCLSSTQQLNLFHVRAIICDRPGSADTQITIRQKVLGLVSAELCQSAYSSMATRRNLTDWDITEQMLQSDSDVHLLEDEDISAHSDSDTTDTNITKPTDNTNCWPTVHKFTGGPSGLW
jgi:hypothetical protein